VKYGKSFLHDLREHSPTSCGDWHLQAHLKQRILLSSTSCRDPSLFYRLERFDGMGESCSKPVEAAYGANTRPS
jgi:hypothetical protein